ncbi:DUF6303 family protein [Streptomyces sp. NBC_00829]|uniref:DUF6303 family protein n=1 Tax=Streptomyces sp. NBC_00829 TaxID=2903679 RepID=UPI0038642C2B|nr:DUF6303 family protein [Streptomyces sp. NBC_00829]
MSGTIRAQLADCGGWHLYVVLPDTGGVWPQLVWPAGASAPTLAERDEALAALGYEIVPGAAWQWCETSDTPDDPSATVWLYASVTVRLVAGVAP